MKKAVCIVGSPNRCGSTAALISEIARGMADAGIDVRTFYLGEMKIDYCHGCNACRDTGECVQRDDMDILAEAILQSDIVCIGSPSYWGDVTAQLKTFFDRSLPLCDTLKGGTPVPAGKIGISAAVRAGRNADENIRLIETIEHYYGHLGIRPVGQLHFEGVGSVEDLGEETLNAAYSAGRNVEEYGNSRKTAYSLAVAAGRDAAVIAELQAALFREEGRALTIPPGKFVKNIRRMLAGEYCGIVAWVRGKVAGYFLYRPVDQEGKAELRLEQYYILPAYRHEGLPAAALRRIVDVCFRDTQYVGLDVLKTSQVGRAFWGKSGCEPEYVRFVKPTPKFSDDNPLQIIGWEKRSAETSGWRAIIRRIKNIWMRY